MQAFVHAADMSVVEEILKRRGLDHLIDSFKEEKVRDLYMYLFLHDPEP